MQNIKRFINKSFKMFCFGFIPLMLLAGTSKENFDTPRLDNGTCSFKVDGELSFNLNGAATFENKTEVDRLGYKTNKLLLHFTSCNDKEMQILEFIIASDKVDKLDVQIGKHKIKDLNHLINNFNGVYGFADLGSVSELPFFIDSGDITITEFFSNNVDGKLEVQLVNAEGVFLKIKGSFNADIKA